MDQFESICNFRHFNNDNIGTYHGPSKLFKIYPVLSHLNTKFQSLYLPGQNIVECVFKTLVNITEKSGKLRKDLRDDIL